MKPKKAKVDPTNRLRLRAVEAISGKRLSVEETSKTYHVALPRFRFCCSS